MPFITPGQTTCHVSLNSPECSSSCSRNPIKAVPNWPETDMRFRPVAGETSLCVPSPMKCQMCYLAPIFALPGVWLPVSRAKWPHWILLPPSLYQPGLAPSCRGEGATDIFNIQYSLSLHIHLHFTLNICQSHALALEINASHHQWGMRSSSSEFLDYTYVRYHDFYCLLPLDCWPSPD